MMVTMVTIVTWLHTEHTRPRKYNFLRKQDLTRKLIFAKIQIYMHILGLENATF